MVVKRNKRTNRKRQYRRRRPTNSFRQNFRCGDYHNRSSNFWNNQSLDPQGNQFVSADMTALEKGAALNERLSNLIYINNLNVRLSAKNTAINARGMRVTIVQIRGSVLAADPALWSNLYINANFVTSGPSGNDHDGHFRINQDVYKVVYDRKFQLNGTNSGETSVRTLNYNIPIKKYISYAFDSTSPRKGQMWIITNVYESPQQAPGPADVEIEGEYTMHYYDVNRISRLPK